VNRTNVDYIIVGQGLAGSCLAFQLIKAGKRFLVIDEPEKNSSTTVAAGLFNPVTGQNLVKTWLCDIIHPYLLKFYAEVEKLSGKKFLYVMPLYRPFGTIEEQNEWMGRSVDPEYLSVLEQIHTQPALEGIKDPLGGLVLKQSGFIKTTVFLDAIRSLVCRENLYYQERFDPSKLQIAGDETIVYDQVQAAAVIFCEGTRIAENPWFGNVPVKPLKGETILIKSPFEKHVIVNRGVYMVPGSDAGEWVIGSTYNLKDKSQGITESGRAELERKLKDLMSIPYRITAQKWGARPTTNDRRPVLGQHPTHKQFFIFNGLGTKG
jgi:glycine oxidase